MQKLQVKMKITICEEGISQFLKKTKILFSVFCLILSFVKKALSFLESNEFVFLFGLLEIEV